MPAIGDTLGPMKRRTKIVCTLGPAVDSREAIKGLIDAGMNVARLNCSHGDWIQKRRWIEWIRELSPEVAPIGILADLQGPKFRVSDIPGGQVELATGAATTVGPEAQVPIDQDAILNVMRPGDRLLMGDGEIEIKLTAGDRNRFAARVIVGGTLKSRKGVTVVGRQFDVPALDEKDLGDLEEAAKSGVDFIALSYVKHADDVRMLRREMERLGCTARVCAKIETREALREIESILPTVDVVMVARGDMGLQMDLDEVPSAQKDLIARCNRAGTPVITATQMLESMVSLPRPTRAEASDVYNAILDGTDAVMLSGETAAGQYPTESVRIMATLCERGEEDFDRAPIERRLKRGQDVQPTDAIAQAVATMERQIRAKAILATSTSGSTPRLMSKYRPHAPILCASWNRATLGYLSVVWGVEAALIPAPEYGDDAYMHGVQTFLKARRIRLGDVIVFTAGVPAGIPGNTNLVMVQTVR